MMNSFLFAAIAISLALIVWLWHGDPKRRRSSGLPQVGNSAGKRRYLAFAVALPGIMLAAIGDSAAVLVWLGSCSIGGWLVTQLRNGGDKA